MFGRRVAVSELHIIGALCNKRSELAGLVKGLEQQLIEHRAALTHLDAIMRLFDPDIRPEEIRLGSDGVAMPGFALVNAFD